MNKLTFTLLIAIVLSLILISSVNAQKKLLSASYYSDYYEGRKMANGEIFYQSSDSIAIKGYKFGTKLSVCSDHDCAKGVVRDRCSCDIDLSKSIFEKLAPLEQGRVKVSVEVI